MRRTTAFGKIALTRCLDLLRAEAGVNQRVFAALAGQRFGTAAVCPQR